MSPKEARVMSDEKEESGPRIARFRPYYFKPVPGKAYLWCACGRSATQPFCDGSHKGSGIEAVRYVAAERDREVLLCVCKHRRAAFLRWLAQQSAHLLRP